MITFSKMGQHGRLGNQIFQYAFLFALAKLNNYNYCIPPNTDIEKCFNLSCSIKNHIENKHKHICGPMDFDISFPKNFEDGCDYLGYYQTEKYFSLIQQDLLNELKFKTEYMKCSYKNYKDIVGINVRRGDYLSNPNHPVITLDYINKAKKYFINKKWLAISDDISWCKQNNIADYYIEHNNYYQALYELSMCSSVIMSNSTFSWWGAYLGVKKEKVIAPKLWLAGDWSGVDWSNIYCKNWIII